MIRVGPFAVTPGTRINGPRGTRQRHPFLLRRHRPIVRIPWGPRRDHEVRLPLWVLRALPRRLWAWVPQ